ncbi:MAG: hypothetical protein L6Q72_05415, partial [Burkholderiaceae bacterium]|nr:hypothetical protein [Burkholderiaceae bacterium]
MGVVVALFIGVLAYTLYVVFIEHRGMELYPLESEAARLASALYFDKLTAIAQLTVAVIGGAWVTLFLQPQNSIRDWPTITCFTLANLSLAISLIVYA